MNKNQLISLEAVYIVQPLTLEYNQMEGFFADFLKLKIVGKNPSFLLVNENMKRFSWSNRKRERIVLTNDKLSLFLALSW